MARNRSKIGLRDPMEKSPVDWPNGGKKEIYRDDNDPVPRSVYIIVKKCQIDKRDCVYGQIRPNAKVIHQCHPRFLCLSINLCSASGLSTICPDLAARYVTTSIWCWEYFLDNISM